MATTTIAPAKPETSQGYGGGGHGPGGSGFGGGDYGLPEYRVSGRTYQLGMWFALAGIVMLFAGFTSAMVVRRGMAFDWVSIAVGSEEEWKSLCRVMEKPALAQDPRFATAALRKQNEAALDQIVSEWTRARDRWQITRALQAAGVAAFPAMSNKDLAEDPHLEQRGYLVRLPHPEVGERIHAGIPWKMSGTPCSVRSPAPVRGADTEEVMKSLLGYTRDKVEQLRKAGVLV